MRSFVIKIIDFLWLMWWLHKCFLDCCWEIFFFRFILNQNKFYRFFKIFYLFFCFLFSFSIFKFHYLFYSSLYILSELFYYFYLRVFFLYWFIDSLLQNFLKIIPLKQKNYILVSFLNFCLDVMFFKKHQTKLIFRRANNRINHFDQWTHPSFFHIFITLISTRSSIFLFLFLLHYKFLYYIPVPEYNFLKTKKKKNHFHSKLYIQRTWN